MGRGGGSVFTGNNSYKGNEANYDYTYVRGRTYRTSYKSYLLDNSKKTIPNVAISPIEHLIQGFNFIVTLNSYVFGFKEVSGLHVSNAVDHFSEGGVNDHQIMVGKPNDDTPTLEFSRGMMIRCNPLLDLAARAAAARVPGNLARKAALLAASAVDPQATLEVGPAAGTIDVYDRAKKLCASYTFLSLGMTEWQVDNLDADNGNIIIESITISHTGLFRVPLGAPNTPLGRLHGLINSDEKVQKDADRAREDKHKKEMEEAKAALLKAQQEDKLKLQLLKERLEKEKQERIDKLNKFKEEYEKTQKERKDAAEKAAKEKAEAKAKEEEEKKEAEEKAKEEAAQKEAEEAAESENSETDESEQSAEDNKDAASEESNKETEDSSKDESNKSEDKKNGNS